MIKRDANRIWNSAERSISQKGEFADSMIQDEDIKIQINTDESPT